MSPRAAAVTAWGLWLFNVAVVLLVVLVSREDETTPWGTAGALLFIGVFSTTGALVASRVPGNPIGWLLCLAASAFSIGGVCVAITEPAVLAGEGDGVVAWAAWVGSFVWLLGIGPAATFVLLLFPDGHLPSRRWRPAAWMVGAALAMSVVGSAFAPGPFVDTDVVSNPVGVPGAGPALELVAGVGLVLLLLGVVVSCASLVVRYRGAAMEQRQQLKWLAWSVPVVLSWLTASLVVGSLPGQTAVDVSNALLSVGLAAVPVAIGVAILRHRLYDIDVVIKLTLVYGVVTALLLGTYFASVLLLRFALAPVTGESDVAVAASTLAVAALFRPLRSRVQDVVDRRFYRSRYDAARTLEGFAGRLRNQLDLDSLAVDLRAVVDHTMQPAHVSLWLRREQVS